MKNRKISNERNKIIFPVLKILKYVQRNEDFNGSLISSKILQFLFYVEEKSSRKQSLIT